MSFEGDDPVVKNVQVRSKTIRLRLNPKHCTTVFVQCSKTKPHKHLPRPCSCGYPEVNPYQEHRTFNISIDDLEEEQDILHKSSFPQCSQLKLVRKRSHWDIKVAEAKTSAKKSEEPGLYPFEHLNQIPLMKYNQWMQSKELQELTASEPLTEEDEFEMQQTWLCDESKCTFIVLDRELYEDQGNEVDAMIGDTNLYLVEEEDCLTAETGVMIAEEDLRGGGRGKEAMLLMLRYGVSQLSVKKYQAKISLSNETSIRMFKKLGFHVECESSVFQEVTLSVEVCPKWISWLQEQTQHFCLEFETETDTKPMCTTSL